MILDIPWNKYWIKVYYSSQYICWLKLLWRIRHGMWTIETLSACEWMWQVIHVWPKTKCKPLTGEFTNNTSLVPGPHFV